MPESSLDIPGDVEEAANIAISKVIPENQNLGLTKMQCHRQSVSDYLFQINVHFSK